ncbi:MAG: hypothetical protein WC523_06010 [Patescibacteria group bacterium]
MKGIFGNNQDSGDVYALQRSELLDEETCNFCLSMDGRTVSVDDEITKIDEFHKDCRGMWVEILKTEVDPPEINGVPKELRDILNKKGSIKLKEPILDIGSLAYDYYKQKKSRR